MLVRISSSTSIVTGDDGFRLNDCRKSKVLDYLADKKGDVDRSTYKFFRHRKGTACRAYFARGSSKCVWAKYAYDYGRSSNIYRGGSQTPYDLVITADYCGSDSSLTAFLAEMESYRPAQKSENLAWISQHGPAQSGSSASTQTTASVPSTTRTLAVSWEGVNDLLVGEAQLSDSRSGRIETEFPDKSAKCSGRFEIVTCAIGTWSLTCTNGLAASGRFDAKGPGQGSTGTGVDSKGRVVKFTVAPKS